MVTAFSLIAWRRAGSASAARGLDVARGYGRYCSRSCYHLATRRHPDPAPRQCPGCGREFLPKFPVFGDQRFCSRSCRADVLCEPLLAGLLPRARQKALGKVKGRVAARTRGAGRPRTVVDPALTAEITRLHALGWGRQAIAARLAMPEHQVRAVLAGKGFSPAKSLS